MPKVGRGDANGGKYWLRQRHGGDGSKANGGVTGTKAEALPLEAGWRRKQGDANNGVVEGQALPTEAGWKRRRSHCQKMA